MTFFANSGITWPQHEAATRQAGGDTFEAVSDLWKIFATIERENRDNPPTVDRAIGSFHETAKVVVTTQVG